VAEPCKEWLICATRPASKGIHRASPPSRDNMRPWIKRTLQHSTRDQQSRGTKPTTYRCSNRNCNSKGNLNLWNNSRQRERSSDDNKEDGSTRSHTLSHAVAHTHAHGKYIWLYETTVSVQQWCEGCPRRIL